MRLLSAFVIGGLLAAVPAQCGVLTVLYGDVDGFGTGATTYKDPNINSAGPGEDPATDIRLIGNGFTFPAFAPTGTLLFGPVLAPIISISITMSMAEFGGDVNPVDGPNSIVLDGLAIPTTFLASFSSIGSGANPNIETLTATLPSTFFALFADGSVSLNGTHISERSGFGSFQVDYVQFDVTTATPEPAALGMVGLGGLGLALLARRRRIS